MNLPKYPQIRIKYEINAPIIVIKNRTQLFEKEALGKEAVKFDDTVSKIDCFLSAAHVIASQQALEKAFGITPSKQTVIIRDLILKAEIAYSHLNHLYKRIMPRLYGFNSYFEFVKKHEKEYLKNNECLLKLEKIIVILARRYPRPINTLIGGHLKIPDDEEKKEIISIFKDLIPSCVKITEFLLKNQKPAFDIIDRYQSLWDLDSTLLILGKIKVNDEEPKSLDEYYLEFDSEKSAFVGPISRINHSKKLLSFTAEKLIKKYGIKFPITNPYQTPLCMAVEAIHCIERSIETIQNTHFENETIPLYTIKESVGFSSVESAKGTIYHYYEIDKVGRITKARIISPIEQNERFLQKAITNIPFDPDKKTRKQVLDDIDFLIDVFYI